MKTKKYHKTFVRQQGSSDCGPACMLMLVQYYCGNANLEDLRIHCGTNVQGTTMLGLVHGANELGLDADGYISDLEALKQLKGPVILNVLKDDILHHYIVLFEIQKIKGIDKYIIGDPAEGIVYFNKEELEKIWVSKTLLTITPTEKFVTSNQLKKTKKRMVD